jgi:hypothetical protein
MRPDSPVALYTDSTLSRAMYSPFCSLTCTTRQRGSIVCAMTDHAMRTRCLIRSMIVSVPLGSHYTHQHVNCYRATIQRHLPGQCLPS